MDKKSKNKYESTPKPPRKISERYLYNSGLYYLKRYPASTGHFQFIMMRKIKKSIAHHQEPSIEECQKILNQTTEKLIELGFLNDDQYTLGMVTSYRKRGLSKKVIIAKLIQKRIPVHAIQTAISTVDKSLTPSEDENPELKAALKHAKSKRLGIYSLKEHQDETDLRRAMGSLARAGFSYDIAKQIMNLNDADDY